ncbi:zinc-binding dehydrogenase [Desertibacillus haloalkaliphilus]|uniref:zinc-binding dehydrogenase n=1 Tax=Desertibacillus haloalkaliphilus TaxID=1328930 RepID=UPI001C26DEF4|nr:zinc-binding dehydrogenase [Desertibacillus haloalkaliphilus]MBU8906119.1 zinc-binding dehydrogenase [Desertibacillus haloalkaliphilus]
MKAFYHRVTNGKQVDSYEEIDEIKVCQDEVKVNLYSAGLNHRDLFVLGRQKEGDQPLIIGSDGAGVIEEVGSNVKNFKVGDEVIINPSLRWKKKSDGAPEGFEILGGNHTGTLAQKIVISAENVEVKPAYLSWEEAGVFSLSALTAYRALVTKGNIQPNETVFLPGIGSGTITFALLFAKALGNRVVVSSRSAEKLEMAKKLGADVTIDTNTDWQEKLQDEKIDIVIESIGQATFNKSLGLLRNGGRLVIFGGTSGYNLNINLFDLFINQITVLGTTMGSQDEFREMLKFVSEKEVRPVIDRIFAITESTEALNHLDDAKQFGKIGIKIED